MLGFPDPVTYVHVHYAYIRTILANYVATLYCRELSKALRPVVLLVGVSRISMCWRTVAMPEQLIGISTNCFVERTTIIIIYIASNNH